MVEVLLPREVKGSELLEKLEESAKELGHETRKDVRHYAIVSGSVKKEPKVEYLRIISYLKQYGDNLYGRFMKSLSSPYFACGVSVALAEQYKKIDIDVESGGWDVEIESKGLRGKAWRRIEGSFERLIDKLYDKLRYSPQTQESANPT